MSRDFRGSYKSILPAKLSCEFKRQPKIITVQSLIDTLPQVGRVKWIGLRIARGAALQCVEHAQLSETDGLHGDRYAGRSRKRQLTLIQAEHLVVIASCLGRDSVPPELLRRNFVVEGINLLALKNKFVRIGSAEIEITGLCHPCSRMETVLGEGGYNAMRGHGGVTARVVRGGLIALEDPVSVPPIG